MHGRFYTATTVNRIGSSEIGLRLWQQRSDLLVCWHRLCNPWWSEYRQLLSQRERSAIEVGSLIIEDALSQEVTCAYLEAADSWRGCDWSTAFGSRGMELAGLKANQTRLLAAATSGEESRAWAEATCWLERVEQDARAARSEASIALDLFLRQEWAEAVKRLHKACALESQYHKRLVWGPLRDLIAAWNHNNCARESTA